MDEQTRVGLSLVLGMILAMVAYMLGFSQPAGIVSIAIAVLVVLVGGWPFWRDMITILKIILFGK